MRRISVLRSVIQHGQSPVQGALTKLHQEAFKDTCGVRVHFLPKLFLFCINLARSCVEVTSVIILRNMNVLSAFSISPKSA